jgi:CDP-paratose 2-epimerase
MKIVITGALGFVGVNLALSYLKEGHEVIGIDNKFKSLGSAENLKLFEANNGIYNHVDIRNSNDVEFFFKNNKNIDAVFNLAAQVAFKNSIENPRLDFEINALGTLNLLESIRLYSNKSVFINASTNQVYGNAKSADVKEYKKRFDFVNLPYGIPEEFPLDFLSPYGCSKGTADQYTIDYSRCFDLKTVVTRFGGIYGDHQYSYQDHGWISFMTNMVSNNIEFNRFGHGKQVRDILYVSDIVSALKLSYKNINKVNGLALNIAGGPKNSISVLELLELLERLTGNKEKSIINPMRKADKLVAYLDIRKAKNLLGWEPQISKDEGIKRLIEWQKTNLK